MLNEIPTKQQIRLEKEKARHLRKSQWWQAKIQKEGKCYYCHKAISKTEVTMDHIVPISRGGRSNKGNIAVSCKDCNTKKKQYTGRVAALPNQ